MNGNRYFLDINAIIASLNGNPAVERLILSASWIGTSVICLIEFLSYSNLSASDKALLQVLINRINIAELPNSFALLERIGGLRIASGLKVPDVIIAEAAISNEAGLITNDSHFNSIPNLSVVNFKI